MCTSIKIIEDKAYFGRNMDIECSFGEQIVITPRNYRLSLKKRPALLSHYAMIGMAAVIDGYPLYADAVNEEGLYAAGLNFPGNAFYIEVPEEDHSAVTPYEFIPWLLGTCKDLEQVKLALEGIRIAAIPFKEDIPLTPLHWHIGDKTGSIVVEPMEDGLKIYENPVGVLTNNPPFPFQLTNLNNYQMLSVDPPENNFSDLLDMDIYGVGMGAIGLPGDVSPMSRFVRAAFNKCNALWSDSEEEIVTQIFHVLNSVIMIQGTVLTKTKKYDRTLYSCCVDGERGIYYYKTYENSQVRAVHLFHENLETEGLKTFSVSGRQRIENMN